MNQQGPGINQQFPMGPGVGGQGGGQQGGGQQQQQGGQQQQQAGGQQQGPPQGQPGYGYCVGSVERPTCSSDSSAYNRCFSSPGSYCTTDTWRRAYICVPTGNSRQYPNGCRLGGAQQQDQQQGANQQPQQPGGQQGGNLQPLFGAGGAQQGGNIGQMGFGAAGGAGAGGGAAPYRPGESPSARCITQPTPGGNYAESCNNDTFWDRCVNSAGAVVGYKAAGGAGGRGVYTCLPGSSWGGVAGGGSGAWGGPAGAGVQGAGGGSVAGGASGSAGAGFGGILGPAAGAGAQQGGGRQPQQGPNQQPQQQAGEEYEAALRAAQQAGSAAAGARARPNYRVTSREHQCYAVGTPNEYCCDIFHEVTDGECGDDRPPCNNRREENCRTRGGQAIPSGTDAYTSWLNRVSAGAGAGSFPDSDRSGPPMAVGLSGAGSPPSFLLGAQDTQGLQQEINWLQGQIPRLQAERDGLRGQLGGEEKMPPVEKTLEKGRPTEMDKKKSLEKE